MTGLTFALWLLSSWDLSQSMAFSISLSSLKIQIAFLERKGFEPIESNKTVPTTPDQWLCVVPYADSLMPI